MATGTEAPARPAIKRRVRGGIPVYVVDGPAPARCALMFRVGRADETLLNGGVTHLVEHLALFPLGDQPYQYNGFVDSHRTVFHAAGRPEECVEFLAAVTGALADLPMHRLEHEHRVLDAEAGGHGSGGLFDALVTYRFGPRGLGMPAYAPVGARRMTAPHVDAWRAKWFTSGNAALIVSGVPVVSLRLTLPPGERRPLVATPTIEPELPACFTTGGGLGVSMVADRGPALAAGLRIVEKRLQKRLRTEMAIVYHVGSSTQFLDARTLHVALGCDPVAEHAADALDAFEEHLDRLAADGPAADELEADRAGLQREWEDPNAGYAVADLLASDELLGAERRTPAAIAKGVRSVTVRDVADAIDRARGTALWAVPEHVTPPSTLRRVSMSTRARVIAGLAFVGGAGCGLRHRIRWLIPTGR